MAKRKVSCVLELMAAPGGFLRSAAVFLAVLSVSAPIFSTERLVRHLGRAQGLPVSLVTSLAQDATGFLWIGTAGGLVRYDGRQMTRWDPERLAGWVRFVAAGSGGRVVTAGLRGEVLEVSGGHLEGIPGPEGEELLEVSHAVFSRDRSLWLVAGTQVLRQDPGGAWSSFSISDFGGEVPRKLAAESVSPDPQNQNQTNSTSFPRRSTVYVATDRGVWIVDPSGTPKRLVEISRVVDMLPTRKGLLLALFEPRVLAWRDGQLREIWQMTAPRPFPRSISLASRAGVIWVALDRFLVALRPGETAEILGEEQGIASGGALLVDREGSLWMGTFTGLLQFPEPETVTWNGRDGLPSPHARFLARTSEGLWVATWQGLGLISGSGWSRRAVATDEPLVRRPMCIDDEGDLWAFGTIGEGRLPPEKVVATLVERRGRRFVPHIRRPPEEALLYACTRAADGGVWHGIGRKIYHSGPGSGPPRRVSSLPGDGAPIRALLLDHQKTLWAGLADGTLCCRKFREPGSGTTPAWSCEPVSTTQLINTIAEASPGDIWVGTSDSGILHRGRSGWEPVPGIAPLPSQMILGLVPSRHGGVWVLGQGILIRVEQRGSAWRVVERLGPWNGVLINDFHDVQEAVDGAVYLTSAAGVTRVLAQARQSGRHPPPVRLVEATLDGRPFSAGEPVPSIHPRNRLGLRFAALSFRDPGLLRFRVRLRSGEPWSLVAQPELNLVDLRTGRYDVEVGASLDGRAWSRQNACFVFRVPQPWYFRGWSLVLFGLLAIGLLYLSYRARLAIYLRLEGQRAQIAADLHDRIGSALGSIGILTGLAASGQVPPSKARELTRQASETAAQLGTVLTDIVWSMRPGSAHLEVLGTHLLAGARRMLGPRGIHLRPCFPDPWPAVRLSPAVVRQVQSIAFEAVANAAGHSGATEVTIGLAPEGRRWRMWVADNGHGLPEMIVEGIGMPSMRERAARIGAVIAWSANPGGGTRVRLLFRPRAGFPA